MNSKEKNSDQLILTYTPPQARSVECHEYVLWRLAGLAGVAAGGIALLVVGWRLRQKREGYALMLQGGIQECGKAQNCVQVCPKSIPLTTSIAAMSRASFKLWSEE